MGVGRLLGTLLATLLAIGAAPARAQALSGSGLAPGRPYLGLSLGAERSGADCPDSTQLLCNGPRGNDRSVRLTAGTEFGPHWGAELSWVDLGRIPRLGGDTHVQGLNLSLVGRARLAPSLGVFGRLGTTYGRGSDTSVMGAAPAADGSSPNASGLGLAWGGGVSYDITARLTATLELDSQAIRFADGSREPVRSTSLGLRWRY